jgi:hypothetical protein
VRLIIVTGQARYYKQTTDLQLYYRERRNDILREAKQYGASIRQLVRLTGISFAIVRDATSQRACYLNLLFPNFQLKKFVFSRKSLYLCIYYSN